MRVKKEGSKYILTTYQGTYELNREGFVEFLSRILRRAPLKPIAELEVDRFEDLLLRNGHEIGEFNNISGICERTYTEKAPS